MSERIINYCHVAGCDPEIDGKAPSCCHGMSIRMNENDLAVFLSAGAVFVPADEDIPNGVPLYYTPDAMSQNGFEVFIVNNCPFLTTEGNCNIEEKKPQACKKTAIGSSVCKKCRVRDGRALVEWYD